ncbi:uncharacterized protein LOC131328443 [Rhododendron vialii]|uniref:uncharacterized protein LOC131328443 n=1 Tax=Rhododendron vialii TaxID=182163 RepID=UPI00265DF573|nr:uncharacterized protein LOC131328443 [Rhododendron vialii]
MERHRGGEGRVRRGLSGPVVGGPPKMSWKIVVVDTQGNPAEIRLVPARVELAPVTNPVPIEWVNEVIRRMLAMENVIRRAVSGMPLELHYPTPTPSPVQPAVVQRSQAQGKASPRRKSAKDPPQKKMTARTLTPPITTWQKIRSAQQAAGNLQAAKEAVARVEERYKLKMRERPSQSEEKDRI